MTVSISDALLEEIKTVAPAGFRLMRNASIPGNISDFVEGMPEEWVKVYAERGYALSDPVMLWSLCNSGAKRWSEVGVNDSQGLLEKAKLYGLEYGVVTSEIKNGRFSILSISRGDREYTDVEIKICSDLLNDAILELKNAALLKQPELDVLWALSQGETLQELAERTDVSISTIKGRLKKARIALGARTATQAVVEATRIKLI